MYDLRLVLYYLTIEQSQIREHWQQPLNFSVVCRILGLFRGHRASWTHHAAHFSETGGWNIQVRIAFYGQFLERIRIPDLQELVPRIDPVEVELEGAQIFELLYAIEPCQVVVIQT